MYGFQDFSFYGYPLLPNKYKVISKRFVNPLPPKRISKLSLCHLQVIQFAKPLEMSPDNCREKSTFVQTADLQFLILLKLGCFSQYISNSLETFSSCFADHYRNTNCYEEYMGQSIQEWTKLNLWKTAFKKFKGGMVCFRFFKGCLPQVLLGPFLNTLSHINRIIVLSKNILHYQRQYCFVKWLFLWLEKSKVWWSPTFLLLQNRISLWKKKFWVSEHSFKKGRIQNRDRNIQNKGC